MFTRFKTTNSVVFLDPHTQNFPKIEDAKRLDVILSPALYWVKKLSLPVKNTRDAKKLLPSIFEDILPLGNYSYAIFKEEDGFIAFAYEDKKIIDELGRQHINIATVANVYFAQSELANKTPAQINDKEALVMQNDLLFIVPLAWLGTLEYLKLHDLKLSKKTVKLHQFSHIIDNSSLKKVGALLSVFILILFVEIFITSQKINSVESQKEQLFAEYKLYPTMMQNKAVLDEFTGIFDKQTKLREIFEAVLKIPLSKDQKISKINYKNKLFVISFEGVDTVASKKILDGLKAYGSAVKSSFKEKTFVIEVDV